MFLLFLVQESGSGVVCELAKQVLSFVSCAGGFVLCVCVCGGVVLVVASAESLPGGSGLWCCEVFSMSGGVPLLLCPVFDLSEEVGELLSFVAVELGCELLLKCLDLLIKVLC